MYVLPTIGVDDELRPWTIETMAARHIEELRKVQPNGPYRVAGFCIGGIIAFEIARQLHAAGEHVDRLVIADGAAMNVRIRHLRPLLRFVRGADENARLTKQAVLMKRLRWYALRLRQISRRPAREQLGWAGRMLGRLRPSFDARATVAKSAAPVASSFEFASALRTHIAQGPGTNVLLMQERAASVYVPGWFDGCIDLIWADDQPKPRDAENSRGWSRFARQVRVHPVSTTHLGLITADIPLFAETLRTVLDGDGS